MDVQTILCWRMCRPCQSPWLSWKHSSGITLLLLERKQFPSILGSSDSRVPFQRSSWTIMFFCSSVSAREISSASFLEEENGWKTLPPVLTLTFANGNLSTNTPLEENVTKMPVKYKRHSKTLRICSIAIAICYISFLFKAPTRNNCSMRSSLQSPSFCLHDPKGRPSPSKPLIKHQI